MRQLCLAIESIHGVLRGGTLENMGCGIPGTYRRDSTKRMRERSVTVEVIQIRYGERETDLRECAGDAKLQRGRYLSPTRPL